MSEQQDNVEIIEIGEPDLPDINCDAADDTDTFEASESVNNKYGAKSLANGVVGAVSMLSIGLSKRLKCDDLALSEEEAAELHEAVSNYAATFDGVELPPWLVLLMVSGALAGNKYMAYLFHKEKIIEENLGGGNGNS